MFTNCSNLEYINLKNFDKNNLDNIGNIFRNVPENIAICINIANNITNKIFSIIKNKCYKIDCSDDWKNNQKNINEDNECIEICENCSPYKYIGKCYDNYINEYLYDNNDEISNYKCELNKSSLYSLMSLEKNICVKCNNNDYYKILNDSSNSDESINFYYKPKGYYLEKDELIYKKCYDTCKTCNIKGNNIFHNCLECKDNFSFIINNNDFINCYENCSYYYYFDNENTFHCTMELKCPKKYPQLIEYKKEYIKYDIKNIIDNLETNLKNKSQAISKFEEIEYYNEILQIAEEYFKSEYYDTSKLDNGQEEIIESEKLKITFTTIENEKNKMNINTTVIDIGECETLLREYYNISKDEKLYLKKIDIIQEGMKTSKIGYDVYYNLLGQNLVKLNLPSCENTKISIFIPISINEPIDKLNSSSGYYNDICYTTTSEDGTDIKLDDRKKDFIDKNKAICQEDCQFSKYDEIKKIAKCSCNVK